jgi:hypothetical protein
MNQRTGCALFTAVSLTSTRGLPRGPRSWGNLVSVRRLAVDLMKGKPPSGDRELARAQCGCGRFALC